jgi:F0F1-type ATP synthase membrane subunit c/vacuolar-type H+-ATPase subunit K
MKKTALIISIVLTVFLYGTPVYAQNFSLSSGDAIGVPIDVKVINGDIITSSTNGYKLADTPYDPQIFGVVSINPALYFKDTTAKNNVPVVNTGNVQVLVSSKNGNIKAGDFITSSTFPGVGEKVTDNGYVLGRAEQNYASSDPNKVGLIMVTLQPHYQQITNNILHNSYSAFTLGLSAATSSPLGVIRYFIAGIITLSSFFFGFRFFARASNRGVEAIGRNPLAKQAILASVLINTVITVSIMLFGVAISYLILVL